jgi:cation:H+ antiporter
MDFTHSKEDRLVTELENHPINLHTTTRNDWLFVLGGMIGLGIGGQLTIDYGSKLALELGIAPAIIGMVIVALGTSMPELVTSIIAAMRKEADLCVGNVIGSNLFNGLMVLPLSSFVSPLSVPSYGSLDIFVSLVLTAALIPIFIYGKTIMSRKIGALFLMIYVGYIGLRVSLG